MSILKTDHVGFHILLFFLLPAIFQIASASESDKILFQQDFSKISDLEKEGWEINDPGNTVSVETGKDGLVLNFRHKPYKGGTLSHLVPAAENEEITLDMNIGAAYTNYQHFSLKFAFENMLFAIKNYFGGHLLLRYSIRDNKWITISTEVPLSKRTRIRIQSFKTEKGKTLQYFIDDMESPVFFEEAVNEKAAPVGKEYISIGNYGLSLGEITHIIYSLTLCELAGEQGNGRSELQKGKAAYFKGVAYGRYQIPEIMKGLGINDITTYVITNKPPALTSQNTFRIDKVPPLNGANKEYIFMVDFPLNKGILKDASMEEIKRNVKNGSTLVILGGLCTLNKGEFQDSLLKDIVPLNMTAPWAIEKLDNKEIFPGGHIQYIHNLIPENKSEVISSIDGKALWISHKHGKGRVVVFLGMPCGKSPQGLFWESGKWPDYAAEIISRKL